MVKTVKCDSFFRDMKRQHTALTFDDIRAENDYSDGDIQGNDTQGRFSLRIPTKKPVVSASMTDVTEVKMAIGLASLGGVGVVHYRQTPEDQAKMIRRVKLYLNGRVENPICVHQNQTIEQVLNYLDEEGFEFRSFPVVDSEGRLVGTLTSTDISFCTDISQHVRDAMSVDTVTADPTITLEKASSLMVLHKKRLLPLVDHDKRVVALYTWSDILRTRDPKALHNVDKNGQLMVAASIGVGETGWERAQELARKGVNGIVIDSAHGDSKPVHDIARRILENLPEVDVIAGNISTYDAAVRLVKLGVHGIKVGQGGGAICTTRIVTGTGTPQVSAIYNCAKAVRDLDSNIPICADGGIRYYGDACIALGVGADSVMLGKMLAGTDEAPGEIIPTQTGYEKVYRGMGSAEMMAGSKDSRGRYGETQTRKDRVLAEGITSHVPYVGSLENVVLQLDEAIKRSMGYQGVHSIDELHQKSTYKRVTSAGMAESHFHDVRQSDNYN